MTFKCLTHGITLHLDGNQRRYETPPGSLFGMPQCRLLTDKEPSEGTRSKCVIERVSPDVP